MWLRFLNRLATRSSVSVDEIMQVSGNVHFIVGRRLDRVCLSGDILSETWVGLPLRCVETCKDGARNWMVNL